MKVFLVGYDTNDNLRYSNSKLFENLKIDELIDAFPDSLDKLYFETGQKVTFQLYCGLGSSSVLPGEKREFLWTASDEAESGARGYAVRIGCGDTSFKVEIGIGVTIASARYNEPPIKHVTLPPS